MPMSLYFVAELLMLIGYLPSSFLVLRMVFLANGNPCRQTG